jgi:serine/threonine protein kinase/tetratricopeptide (TPR) repeat protein
MGGCPFGYYRLGRVEGSVQVIPAKNPLTAEDNKEYSIDRYLSPFVRPLLGMKSPRGVQMKGINGQRMVARRYEILEQVGKGTTSEVFRAFDSISGRIIALKMLSPDIAQEEEILHFQHEFEALAGIAHPHVIHVYDFGLTDDGSPYFTMEYIEGKDLQKSWRGKEYPWLGQVMTQILSALESIHARGIIHLDLKPSNVMVLNECDWVRDRPIAKLMDFGLSRFARYDPATHLPSSGTLYYMAPEVIQSRSKPPDQRADLYSLGVVLYELLTGRRPFEGDDPITIARLHLRGKPSPLSHHTSSCPPGLEKTILKLLAKDPADRYQSAGEAAVDLTRACGSHTEEMSSKTERPFILNPTFVGREREIQWVKDMIATRGGKQPVPSLIVVTGPSGIGKSRFLEELRLAQQVEGSDVLQARCSEYSATAFQPFRAIVEDLVMCLGDKAEPLLRRWARSIRKLVPSQAKEIVLKEEHILTPEDLSRDLLLQDIAQFIAEASRQLKAQSDRPVVIVIEDLHWADPETVELLTWVAREVYHSKAPVTLCTSCRKRDLTVDRSLEKLYCGVREEPWAQAIHLTGMSRKAISHMVCSILGVHQLDREVVDTIYQDSGGNPFFVEQITKVLVEEGILRQRQGRCWVDSKGLSHFVLPNSLKTMILKRLEHLAGANRKVLSTAAVIGATFDLSTLLSLNGFDKTQLTTILSSLVEERVLIRRIRSDKVIYQFAHPAIRETLYDQVDERDRRSLHRRLGSLLEERYGEDSAEVSWDLGHHYLRGGNRKKAVFYLQKAGDYNRKMRAHEQAITCYETAYSLTSDDRERGEIALALGYLYKITGDYSQAIDRYLTVLTVLHQMEDRISGEEEKGWVRSTNAVVKKNLGVVTQLRGNYHEAIAWLEQSLQQLEETGQSGDICDCLNELGTVHRYLGDYEQALNYFQQGLALADQKQNHIGLAHSLNNMAGVYYRKGNDQQAMDYYSQSLSIRQQIGDQNGIAACLNNMAMIHMRSGHLDRAITNYRKSLAILKSIGNHTIALRPLNNLAVIYYMQGKWSRSLNCQQQCLEMAQRLGDTREISGSLNNIGIIHLARGEYAEARDYLLKGLHLKRQRGNKEGITGLLNALGKVYVRTGAYPDARTTYRELQHEAEALSDSIGLGTALSGLGLVAARTGNISTGRDLCLEGLNLITAVRRGGAACEAMLALAWIAGEEKAWDEMKQYVREALTIAQRLKETELKRSGRLLLVQNLGGQGLIAEAIDEVEQILATVLETDDPWSQAMAHRLAGALYREAGKWLLSEQGHLIPSAHLFEKLGACHELARSYLELARLYHVGEEWDRARAYTQKAREILAEIGAHADLKVAEKMMASIPPSSPLPSN